MKRILLALIATLSVVQAHAQIAATAEIGANPYKSYSGGAIDHIQMQNGKLYLSIPLLSYPQLGKLALSFSLLANSSSWVPVGFCDTEGDCSYSYGNPDICNYQTPGIISGEPAGDGQANVQVVLDQQLNYCRTLTYTMQGTYPSGCLGVGPVGPSCLLYEAPIAAEYHVLPTYKVYDSTNATHTMGFSSSNYSNLFASDGSGLELSLGNSGSLDEVGWEPSTVTITEPSGVTNVVSTTSQIISDLNGNTINANFESGNINDSVGRTVPFQYASGASVPVSNCPNLGIPGQPASGAYSWIVPGLNGSSETYIFCGTTIPIFTNFFGLQGGSANSGCQSSDADTSCDYIYWNELNYTAGVLQSVVLPDGTFWGFGYDTTATGQDRYGDLTEVVLPSGGSLNYTYQMIQQCGYADSDGDEPYGRAVVQRVAAPLVGNNITRNYSYSPTQTVETDSAGNQTLHSFTIDYPTTFFCGAAETSTKWYTGAASTSATPLREVDTTYQSVLDPQDQILNTYRAIANRLPSIRTTYEEGINTKNESYGYDLLFTDVQPWIDQTNIGDPIQLLYELSAVTAPIYYANPTSVSDGIAVKATKRWASDHPSAQALNLVDIPEIQAVCAAGVSDCIGQAASKTTYSYDGAGNATSVTRMISGSQAAVTTQTYSASGMVTSTTDPIGNAGTSGHTTIYNRDSSGLYVTNVQSPTTNGIGHTRYYQQDFNTGLATAISDENASSISDLAHITRYGFDVAGRLKSVIYPAGGGSVTQCYTDVGDTSLTNCPKTAPPFSVIGWRTVGPSSTETSSVEYDGLGRVLQSEAPSGAITATTYDQRGQVASVTNPYYSSPNGITSYLYDPIGRKIFQCQPDNGTINASICAPSNSYLAWSYNGNTTTSTDEVGNISTRTNDARNRLVQVIEPGGLTTNYTYDPLDNLTNVNQLGKTTDTARNRSFSYDGLSRLMCASNVENSTIPCPASFGSVGVTTYSYDLNSNLQSKANPRGTSVATYSYDALNRLTGKIYSSPSSTTPSSDPTSTPSSCYQYDSVPGGIGWLGVSWTQVGACMATFTQASALTSRRIMAYDLMGRIKAEQQCTPVNCTTTAASPYPLHYDYDWTGNIIHAEDGIGQAVWMPAYDQTGRLTGVSALTVWPTSLYPAQLLSIQSYLPSGTISQWTMGIGSSGPALTGSKTEDIRLRPSTESVSGHD